MTLSSSAALALALAALAPGALAQIGGAPLDPRRNGPIHVLSGPPGGAGELRTYDGFTGQDLGDAFATDDLRLLPIDFVGRVELLTFLPDRPRWLDDVPAASRLALPQGQGMLYHYSRRADASTILFGYLRVRADGRRTSYVERRGIGTGGGASPYLGRVAVAGDGRSILVATHREALGDLLEIDLGSGAVHNHTAGIAPIAFSDAGLWLGEQWGFAAADEGIWRFERGAGALAQEVPFARTEEPSYFTGEATMSLGRQWAVATAGDGPLALYAFVFGRTGSARRASSTPAALSGAGFLPESSDGPYLAVSDDGENCAWRVENTNTRECFLARVESTSSGNVQISSDQYYLDTLDEIGQMTFFQARKLHVAVGSAAGGAPGTGIEDADLFRVELANDFTPQFTNLSRSSGDASPPFLSPGTIEIEFARRIPETSGTFLYDGKGERVLGVFDDQVGAALLLDQVKDVYFVEKSDPWIAFAARREFEPRPREIYRVPASLSAPATLLVAGNSDMDYPRAWVGPDGWLGYRVLFNDTIESMHRVNVASGVHQLFPSSATVFGDTIGFTPWGAMLVREGGDGGPCTFVLWPLSGPRVPLAAPSSSGVFLPGS